MTVLTGTPAYRAGLVWNTWRQHRLVLAGLFGAFAVSAIVMLATGLPAHAAYDSYLAHHCFSARLPLCGRLSGQLRDSTHVLEYLPWLIAVFVGAPLVAREFDTDTFRFAMTQGASIRRQLTVRLAGLAAVVLAGSILLGLLATWCLNPELNPAGGNSPWDQYYFNLTAVTLPAWTLLALCLGVLAGAIIKRVVPAMAAALAAVVLVMIAGTGAYSVGRFESGVSSWPGATLIPRLFKVASVPMPGGLPLIGGPDIPSMSYPDDWPGPHGSLEVGGFFTRAGVRLSGPAARALVSQVPKPALTSTARLRTWLAARRISFWITYQPASRYWLFQGIAAAILLALAGAAGFSAVRLAGRRR